MSGLTDLCVGRWPGILERFGIDARYLTGRHGPCPMCAGTDRFRFDDKGGRGTFFCNQCGSGDGFTLLQRLKGWTFKELAAELEPVVGKIEPRAPDSKARGETQLREAMNRLWRAGVAVDAMDPVGRYLASRAIRLDALPNELRFVAKCFYREKGSQSSSAHPAMVARVRGPDGTPATIHRTYLTPLGAKANVAEVRKLMPGKLPPGSAIRLAMAGPTLGIAEGIETALSASIIFGVPVWAAVSAAMLMQFEPPAETESLIIFGDNDANFSGQFAAYGLASTIRKKRPDLAVKVEMPPDVGTDWNDALRASNDASTSPANEFAEIAA